SSTIQRTTKRRSPPRPHSPPFVPAPASSRSKEADTMASWLIPRHWTRFRPSSLGSARRRSGVTGEPIEQQPVELVGGVEGDPVGSALDAVVLPLAGDVIR